MRIFKEEQRFTQPLIIVILSMSALVTFGLVIHEYTKEDSTMKLVELVTVLGIFLGATLPIFFFKLITRIDEKGIHYRFFPFHRKQKSILWLEIQSAYVRKYDAISEYGGWGLKGFRRKNGQAINTKGNIGIQLELKNSKKLLIGTQKETEAKKVLEYYQHKLTHENP
jgi:hypothetical protein